MNKNEWSVIFSPKAEKVFLRLAKTIQKRIKHFLYETLSRHPHPKQIGIPLSGPLEGYWR